MWPSSDPEFAILAHVAWQDDPPEVQRVYAVRLDVLAQSSEPGLLVSHRPKVDAVAKMELLVAKAQRALDELRELP